jgi:hypothetical protein
MLLTALQLLQVIVRIILKPTILIIKLNSKEGHSLELEANYNENDDPENAVYTNLNRDSKSLINSFTNDVTTLGKNSIINLDYVNPLTETTKLELGLEARDESTANNLFRDNAYSSDFTYDRTIYSAYATLGKQWKKWSFQAGTSRTIQC